MTAQPPPKPITKDVVDTCCNNALESGHTGSNSRYELVCGILRDVEVVRCDLIGLDNIRLVSHIFFLL